MLKMVDGTGIIGVDMICPLGVSTPQPPNYDRVELEGTGMLVLPNSLDAPLERLELGGKTEQVQTTGAQLITLANRTDVGDTELGGKKWLTKISEQAYSVYNNYQKSTVEFMGNNSFKLSHNTGASSTNGNGLELPVKIKPDTDYTLSYTSSISEVLVYFIQMDSGCNKLKETSSRNKKHTFHSEANAEWVILKFASVLNNSYVVSNIQFEKGTVATSFEPYTGGKPSPSPEYQQEIKNSGKWNEETQKYEVDVKITGKNLLDTYEKAEKDSEFYSVNDDGSLSQLKSDVRPYSDVPSTLFLKSGVYYFSLFNTGVTFKCYNAEADEVFAEIKEPKSILVNLRKDANIKYKVFSNGGSSKNVRVMVSKTKASEYEPYTEQTLTLTSDRPITKWDRLVEKGGEIGWLYGTKKYVVTGKENFTYGSENYYTGSRIDMFFEIRDATGNEAIMRDLSFVPSIWHLTDKEGFCINGKQLHIGLYNTRIVVSDDAAKEEKIKAYKEFMAKRYADGNPFEVYYKTTETEFIPLPQPEQNAIRALKTYYPTTVITTDGGELDPDIKVTYRKEI